MAIEWLPFLYRCPNTGRQVQGWLAADLTDYPDDDNAKSCQSLAPSVHPRASGQSKNR
jgi:hypothetical protein